MKMRRARELAEQAFRDRFGPEAGKFAARVLDEPESIGVRVVKPMPPSSRRQRRRQAALARQGRLPVGTPLVTDAGDCAAQIEEV